MNYFFDRDVVVVVLGHHFPKTSRARSLHPWNHTARSLVVRCMNSLVDELDVYYCCCLIGHHLRYSYIVVVVVVVDDDTASWSEELVEALLRYVRYHSTFAMGNSHHRVKNTRSHLVLDGL